ncbi:MAG: DUF4193 family protein [Acidimicrobiia bacterium]|nr:DUF4193 family protein [Acidimicrobiia bacterium]
MADDEEIEVLDDVDEGDDDLVLDDVEIDDVDADVDVDAIISEPSTDAKAAGSEAAESTDDDDDDDDGNLDLEEELHPDDVEEPLDVLLAERTAAERIDEEEADLEDDDEPDNPAEGTGKIVPRRDDEFLCRSCFLVKPRSQLAKGEKDLCRDCE